MGAKIALIVYADGDPADLLRQAPALDRDATSALVAATHPGWTGTATSTGSLLDCVYPPDGFVYAGSFPRIDVLAPDSGIVQDTGTALPFEAPFWAGEHPVLQASGSPARSPYPLPFHSLDLGEAALRELLGFTVEGRQLDSDVDASAVQLTGCEVPSANPIATADIEEFVRIHKRIRYTVGPGGTLIPIDE